MNFNNVHPYIRYAGALLVSENNLNNTDEITPKLVSRSIKKALSEFRLQPVESLKNKKKVKYRFEAIEKGKTEIGIFLSPNVIASDKGAGNLWNAAHEIIKELETRPDQMIDAKMSFAPISGEYLSFSAQGSIGRGNPKLSRLEAGLASITTLTSLKPCLQFRIDKSKGPEMFNVCFIPDIPIEDMIKFIDIFKHMRSTRLDSDLMAGPVSEQESAGKSNSKTYKPNRPLIYKGNFPNPPRSSSLGSVALLGAIGEYAKEAEDAESEKARKVLDNLKNSTFYMIQYGSASTFSFNHYVIKLAKVGKLREIVDSIYHSKLYNNFKRISKNTEYQKFDLFSARFLQLFNKPAFKDFLAFRAEYPQSMAILFETYFKEVEQVDKIHPDIIQSAKALGRWLNQVAYFTAKAEIKEGTPNYWEELRKFKAKVLVELESSTFSAKTGDALISQVVTRAGRLSGMDAPESSSLYMEKTMSGELNLDTAKNLIIAFSRLISKAQKKEEPSYMEEEEVNDENLDLSNV